MDIHWDTEVYYTEDGLNLLHAYPEIALLDFKMKQGQQWADFIQLNKLEIKNPKIIHISQVELVKKGLIQRWGNPFLWFSDEFESKRQKKLQEELIQKKLHEELEQKKLQEELKQKKLQEELEQKKLQEELKQKKLQEELEQKKLQEELIQKKLIEDMKSSVLIEKEKANRKIAKLEAELVEYDYKFKKLEASYSALYIIHTKYIDKCVLLEIERRTKQHIDWDMRFNLND
jgi:hypothetical protein